MISFLSSEVGRGHPFYLDGLVTALESAGRGELIARRSDVFSLSHGLSLLAWRSVRATYRIAARGGVLEGLYRQLRGQVDYDGDSALLDALGRDLRTWAKDSGILIVDHPALVGTLEDRPDVWYMHGEHASPPEAIVRRAALTFVPTETTAAAFIAGGVPRDRLVVTGLCVEPGLVPGAEHSIEVRRSRIASKEPLTVAFFSSGAEPILHVAALGAAVSSLTSVHRTLVFARRGGSLERRICRLPARILSRVEVIGFGSRVELDAKTLAHFDGIDAVVSPPHERSNWALALGVPFFLVGPDVGPFAPENRALLLRSGVAVEIASVDDAVGFSDTLAQLRSGGALLEMSRRGGARPLDGFARAAEYVASVADRRVS